MHPSLWALWKVEAEITHSLSRSKLLAASGREHRPLYSQPLAPATPSSLGSYKLTGVREGAPLSFVPAAARLGSRSQKQNPWKRNSSWKTLQRPGDKEKQTLPIFALEGRASPECGNLASLHLLGTLEARWQIWPLDGKRATLALDFADRASLVKAKERKTCQARLWPRSSRGQSTLCTGSPRAVRHENPMLSLLLIKLAQWHRNAFLLNSLRSRSEFSWKCRLLL